MRTTLAGGCASTGTLAINIATKQNCGINFIGFFSWAVKNREHTWAPDRNQHFLLGPYYARKAGGSSKETLAHSNGIWKIGN
jgi:hypothetical protein